MNAMQQLTQTLYARPLREQALLLAGGAASALMLAWLLLVSPVNGLRDEALTTLARTQQTHAQVNALAAQLEAARAGQSAASASRASMTELIDASLRKHQLGIRGIQPGSQGEMFVRLEAAPTQAVWRWLHEMESVQQMSINELTINPTEKVGWVLLTARLEKTN